MRDDYELTAGNRFRGLGSNLLTNVLRHRGWEPFVLTLLQLLFLALHIFVIVLLARLVADYVLMFSRRWQPGRGAAAGLEIVWSITDPPLRALRRLIPPLRLGRVNLDLGFLLLFLAVTILERVVFRLMLSA